jgi:tyrosinase
MIMENCLRITTVHVEKMRWLRLAERIRFDLPLAVVFSALCGWSCAGSMLLASAPGLTLDASQHEVPLAVDAAHAAALRQIARGQPGSLPGDPASYRSALLVLDDVALTDAGARGGYFYKIYLAPSADAGPTAQQPAGSLGPFEIAAARQQGTASLRYPLGTSLGSWGAKTGAPLVVSFRRAGGAVATGPLIRIGSVRLELSTEAGN